MTTKKAPAEKAPAAPRAPTDAERVLLLRTCGADLTSYGGFAWPRAGHVEAPDWNPAPTCGEGLHGLLWGEGDASLLARDADAAWLVVAAHAGEVVDLYGKVKVPRAWVLYVGTRDGATAYLRDHGGQGRAIAYGTATAGHDGTATVGDHGTATVGVGGAATAGHYGTATAGHDGTATAGVDGTATAGVGGTATAGHYGTATAGVGGTATAGHDGTAAAGEGGILQLRWHDGTRYRVAVRYVGEDGILPGVRYRATNAGAVKAA